MNPMTRLFEQRMIFTRRFGGQTVTEM